MNKAIARHKFWLHQTECIISTVYVEVLHEYQTVVMYMDDFEEIDSYTTYSKQEALKLHESLVEQWKDRLNKNRLVKADRFFVPYRGFYFLNPGLAILVFMRVKKMFCGVNLF